MWVVRELETNRSQMQPQLWISVAARLTRTVTRWYILLEDSHGRLDGFDIRADPAGERLMVMQRPGQLLMVQSLMGRLAWHNPDWAG